jgi:hypothetical protein
MTDVWFFRVVAVRDEVLHVMQYASSPEWLSNVPHDFIHHVESCIENDFRNKFGCEPDSSYWEVGTLHV